MLKTNSKDIKEGDTFVAIRGEKSDGHKYIEEAIKNGAKTVVAENGLYSVETIIVNDTKEYLRRYVEQYKEELKDMYIIGMTGTNGKTTTCYLIYQALNYIGKKCAYIGTIGFYLDKKVRDLKNTTPGILEMYEMLQEAKKAGYKYVVMEVSSHALVQDRVHGISFDVAIISNVTQDHLDYHKTMDEYAKAKQKLFKKIKTDGYAIIPSEIEYKDYFELKENRNITYGNKGDYVIENINLDNDGTTFTVLNNKEKKTYKTKLIGRYNVLNIMNVIIILNELGIDNIENIISILMPPPGRMEIIEHNDSKIIIDYAHTPDAVENILKCIHEIATGKIYVIIGCGGDRDKEKRPIMAKISTDYADKVIFTSDNPRSEDASIIIRDMIKNLDNDNYEIEINREKAILKGIQKCIKNDILLILGKGHENYQIIGNDKIHFDDKEIVLKYL